MTQNIIRMAREAGIDEPESDWMYWAAMERFAALVRADEREACAKVCDEMEQKAEEHGTECCKWPTPSNCAYAIRARGETK
jgi:hypothetical protein